MLDAGGTLVSDERAPAFWVVADADGNRACICTWEGRSAWADAGRLTAATDLEAIEPGCGMLIPRSGTGGTLS